MWQFYIIKTRKNVCITSDITINARHVDNNNARMIASLTSLPPVVSGAAFTAANMASSLSPLRTSSLSAGTVLRLASVDNGTPLATSSSAMADDDADNDDSNDGGARGVASAVSSQPSKADKLHPPPLDCHPLAPTSTVVLSSPCGPPGRIVPALGEVVRRVPHREGVVGAVIQGCSLPSLALLCLAHRRLHPPSASPIFPSTVATASSTRTIASPPPLRCRMFAAMTMTQAHEYHRQRRIR